MGARARLWGHILAMLLSFFTASLGQELQLTSGREFVRLMRQLSGPLNMTLDIPAGAVINASEGLPLPPIVGPGYCDQGVLHIRGPSEGPRPVLNLGHLRDVSASRFGFALGHLLGA